MECSKIKDELIKLFKGEVNAEEELFIGTVAELIIYFYKKGLHDGKKERG